MSDDTAGTSAATDTPALYTLESHKHMSKILLRERPVEKNAFFMDERYVSDGAHVQILDTANDKKGYAMMFIKPVNGQPEGWIYSINIKELA